MGFYDTARGRLHYRRWPVSTPRAVALLLPGLGQHSGHYHRFARELNRAQIALWALDTAGHGLSEGDPRHPGTLAELVADAAPLVAMLRTEYPRTPWFMVGHSLGAATILTALGAAVPDDPTGSTPLLGAVDPPLVDAGLCGVVLCGTPQRVLGNPVSSAGPVLPAGLAVLAVHGVDDRRARFDAVKIWTAREKTVNLREYPDAGHDLLHEPIAPQVTSDITDWIGELSTSSRWRL